MTRHADWLAQARRDLGRARLDVAHEYWEWACFTSQQAAEKAVKAVFLYHGHDAWGHAITPMLRNLPAATVADASLIAAAQILDAHYIPARYPNGFASGIPADYFNEGKAREALDAADSIIRFCEDHIARSGSGD